MSDRCNGSNYLLTWRNKQNYVLQMVALKELYYESPELFAEALKCDPSPLPFSCVGPVQTLPVNGYLAPLGGYIHQDPDNATDEDDEKALKLLEKF